MSVHTGTMVARAEDPSPRWIDETIAGDEAKSTDAGESVTENAVPIPWKALSVFMSPHGSGYVESARLILRPNACAEGIRPCSCTG